MPRLNDKGFSQIVVFVILLLGLLAGLYLVKQTQVFKSKATSELPDHAKNTFLAVAQSPVDQYGDRIVFQNARYYVEYQPTFDLFVLVINDTPLESVRAGAEKDLLQLAEYDLQSLCSLHFNILASKFVTDDGYNATDDKLGICKQYQMDLEGSQTPNQQSFIDRVRNSIISALQGRQTFLSDKPIVSSQKFPVGIYISLCRGNNTNSEGVWQTGENPRVADFLYNQEAIRCNEPVPNYLVFTQSVPKGAYLSLCAPDSDVSSSRELVWQVNESGRTAEYLYTQDGCTPPPSELKLFSFISSAGQCRIGEDLCSVDFLTPYFGNNASSASKICQAESGGVVFAFNGYDAGLFQINLSSHGKSKDYLFNVGNNIEMAVSLSKGGANWELWSAAYEYACINNERIPGCGFYSGKVPWHESC